MSVCHRGPAGGSGIRADSDASGGLHVPLQVLKPILVSMVAIALGCDGRQPSGSRAPTIRSNQLVQSRRKQDFLQATNFLNHLDQYEPRQSHEQILQFLNRWIEGQKPDPNWLIDPMVSRLPSRYLSQAMLRDLSELEFRGGFLNRGLWGGDVDFLQEAVWMRDVSNWVARDGNLDPDLAEWFHALEDTLDAAQLQQLKTAAALFDWTVRNIQLEEAPRDPAETGTGYKPWEVLQLGRGDFLHRARVFILLARQQGIPVVMLALKDRDADRLRVWLPAVSVGERLYLFDTKLGLPVPAADDRGIAALDELLDRPADDAGPLRRLDLPGRPYPVADDDVKTVVALVDASAGFVSQRMRMIELRLTGEAKMVLSVKPSKLAAQVRKCKGIADVRPWTLPYEATLVQIRRAQDPEKTLAWMSERFMFDGCTPLYRGRLLHLGGTFEGEDGELGARAFYMQCRPSDAAIRRLLDTPTVREQSGLVGSPEDLRRREEAAQLATRVKQDASYWLGLIAFDAGQYEVAINDFQKRSLDAHPDGPRTQGARYNLARALERLGRRENDPSRLRAAIEAYRQSADSPQHHGNLLRARRVEAMAAEPAPRSNSKT